MKPVRYTTDDDHPEAVYVHEQGYLVKWDDYAALAAENEQLKAAGLMLAESSDNAIWSLKQQLAISEAKVAWLQKADRLVIWDGEKWMPRPDMPRTSLPATHKSE